MDGTKIVTSLVILSMTMTVGCKAKFTSKNKPATAQPMTGATGGNDGPTAPSRPTGPTTSQPQVPSGPVVAQPPQGPQQPAGPIVGPRPAQPPACLTGDDTSIDKGKPVQHQTVVFKRGRQMVWRKDCDGHVISKQYETLGGNTMKAISVRPVGSGATASVFNRSTCHATNSQHQIRSDAQGIFKFNVSTQKTNHAMLVKKGVNLIDYTIGSEQGTLILTVRIEETEDDCVVIAARGCEPKREASWSDGAFTSN